MLQDYEIPSRRNFLSFSKSFTDFNRWFPDYQRQDVNVNQVSWITLKKNITKHNVYYKFVTGQLFQIATTLSLTKCYTVYYMDTNMAAGKQQKHLFSSFPFNAWILRLRNS